MYDNVLVLSMNVYMQMSLQLSSVNMSHILQKSANIIIIVWRCRTCQVNTGGDQKVLQLDYKEECQQCYL